MPKTFRDSQRGDPAKDQAQQGWRNEGKLPQSQMVRPLGIEPEQKRPENRSVEIHFPMQKRAEDFSEDLLDIRRADDLAHSVKSFSQRHCDQFRIGLFSKFFLSLPQAQIGRVGGKPDGAR